MWLTFASRIATPFFLALHSLVARPSSLLRQRALRTLPQSLPRLKSPSPRINVKATDTAPENSEAAEARRTSESLAPAMARDIASGEMAKIRERLVAGIGKSGLKPSLRALVAIDPEAAFRWVLEADLADSNLDREIVSLFSPAIEALAGRKEQSELLGRIGTELSGCLSATQVVRIAQALQAGGDSGLSHRLVDEALERMPTDSSLLRERANRAVRESDVEGHVWLSRLARSESGAANALRVFRSRSKLPEPDRPQIRAALLSSFTIDPVVPHLDLELRALDLVPEIYVAPFDTWEREVLDPASGLRAYEPEIVFLSISIDDLAPELAGAPDAEALTEIGEQALDRVLSAVRNFVGWSNVPLVVHSFHSAYSGPLGILEGRAGTSRSRWLAALNAALADGLAEFPRAYLLDMTELLLRRSDGSVDNPKMRHMGGMRLGEGVTSEVARAYTRYAAPLVGKTRKVVVLDLDNTLWGGVVGEDGPHGIKLSVHGPGSEFQEFQRYLLGLTEQGVLLAINSKNNAEDAWEVIRGHEGMILREEHFSAARINWQPKPENLMEIAAELNLGVDSLIFVDDNPNERERVRQFLPQVLVPELPLDSALYRQTIEALPELQRLEATLEDQQRVALYREKKERETARESVGSVAEYLETLDIHVDIAQVDASTLPRVHQLFQRTNQFNTTTRRYEVGELEQASADPDTHLYTLRARDRFGDHGLVAVALARTAEGGATWCVDSFLMSCRVIGYGIETALLSVLDEDARAAGANRIRGEYIPTAKNPPVAELFVSHGFEETASEEPPRLFERMLDDEPINRPDWLTMEVSDEA